MRSVLVFIGRTDAKAETPILWRSAFFMVQFSHPYMTTGKTIALTRWTFIGKVMSLLFNILSRFVIVFLPRSKHLLISWLQSPSVVSFKFKRVNKRKFGYSYSGKIYIQPIDHEIEK